MSYANVSFNVATGENCNCCGNNAEACWLTVPTILIDGSDTPFANSTVAQNFFDNSGAIIGCTSSFPGDPACDCLIEAQTNHAAGKDGRTSFESYSATNLDFFSRSTSDTNAESNHSQLFKLAFGSSSDVSFNVTVSGGVEHWGVGSNITLLYENYTAISSNLISNANIDPNVVWSTYQNFTINTAGNYCFLVFSNTSPVGNISGTELSVRYNVSSNVGIDVCSVRANYGSGYITCQSAAGP